MITIDMSKAKAIGHDIRRRNRDAEFKPYDDIISKQIPGKDSAEAEAQRQKIRDKYADIQQRIDAATDTSTIKSALGI